MKFASTEALKSIGEQLTRLSDFVPIINSANYYDTNKGAENFFRGLLNLCLGVNLKNMNAIEPNYPAIDLGDSDARVCVQVTSINSSTKLKATLKQFVKKELHNTYDELIFFVISSRPLPRIIHSDKVTVFLWNVERLLPYLSTRR